MSPISVKRGCEQHKLGRIWVVNAWVCPAPSQPACEHHRATAGLHLEASNAHEALKPGLKQGRPASKLATQPAYSAHVSVPPAEGLGSFRTLCCFVCGYLPNHVSERVTSVLLQWFVTFSAFHYFSW